VLDLTVWTIASLFFLVLLQHETAVVLWVTVLSPKFEYWLTGYTVAFVVVSLSDLIWIYLQFLLFKNSFHWLAHFRWVQRLDENLQLRKWYQRLRRFFGKRETTSELVILESDSRFRKYVKQSGYVGILLCSVLPGPALKEIGIVMALTPKYGKFGFQTVYLAAMLKTAGTMAAYAGVHTTIQNWFM